jgi:hypothetical protein
MKTESLSTIDNIIENFRVSEQYIVLDKIASFLQIISNLTKANRMLILRCFIEVGKVISSRQTRLRKPLLKMREIRSAVELIIYHYDKTSTVTADASPFSELLGKEITEKIAIDYFEKNIEGIVKDVYGREILISPEGLKHLYKDDKGEHTIDSKYFQDYRAKRMPWIKPTISNTKEIYKKREGNWIIYMYIQCFDVPTKNAGYKKNYLIVIVRAENPQAPFKFVTAYHTDDHEELLKHIEDFEPFNPKRDL